MNMIVGASAVASATLVPSAASDAGELNELFAKLWDAYRSEQAANERLEAEADAREKLICEHQTWPDNQDHWTKEDAGAYWAALCEAEPKTAMKAAFAAYMAASEVVDGICRRIVERYPATVQALAASALMAGRSNPKVWERDDYEDEQMQTFFDAVFVAAGAKNPFMEARSI